MMLINSTEKWFIRRRWSADLWFTAVILWNYITCFSRAMFVYPHHVANKESLTAGLFGSPPHSPWFSHQNSQSLIWMADNLPLQALKYNLSGTELINCKFSTACEGMWLTKTSSRDTWICKSFLSETRLSSITFSVSCKAVWLVWQYIICFYATSETDDDAVTSFMSVC